MPQLEVKIVSLTGADVGRMGAGKYQVGAEFSLTHLRIDLAHRQNKLAVVALERSLQPHLDAVDVMLVDLGLNLVIAQVIDLPNHGSGGNALPQFHIE